MIGYADYNNERVCILELINYGRKNQEFIALISYGGPIWVNFRELSNLQLIITNKKGA
jgi:hypothetical protein